jgi:hypothetical protein
MKRIHMNPTKRWRRRGATLIDVATGSMLLAVLLIPSIHLISESHSMHARLAHHDIVLFEAEQLIESTKVSLSEPTAFDAAYASGVDVAGTITVSDGPDLNSRVRVAADPGVPGARLLTIVVDVWHDIDGDLRVSPGEPNQSLRTQWASP